MLSAATPRRLYLAFLPLPLCVITLACGGVSSSSVPAPPPPQASLFLSVSPEPVVLVPGTSSSFFVTAQESGTSVTPTVTVSNLPSGITTSATSPQAVPPAGVLIALNASNTLAPGQYNLVLLGQAGSAMASTPIAVSVQSAGALPTFYFVGQGDTEIAVPVGGSSSFQFITGINGQGQPPYLVSLSIANLPSGTSASFNPNPIAPGQTGTVTITAASTAPLVQNAELQLTGTPTAAVPQANLPFVLDVSPPPGSLPNNRTDYLSTEATPYSAAYDSMHNLIFSSNESWNRIDVVSPVSRTIIKSISMPDPRGVDVAIDFSRVWVTTGSQQVFEIDPVSFAVTRHLLPQYSGSLGLQSWEGNLIYSLSDGTVLLNFGQNLAIWNPSTNALTPLPHPTVSPTSAIVLRSGNGQRIFVIGDDSGGSTYSYDVPSATLSPVVQLAGYAIDAAVNFDGSRVAVYDVSGLNMRDGNFTLLGPLPGGGVLALDLFQGGMIFSPTSGYLYVVCMPLFTPLIFTIDSNTLQVVGIAPALPMIPVMTELSPPFYMPEPFGVDPMGIVFGIEDFGIAFDDGAFFQNLVTNEPGTPSFLQHMSPYSGPLAGGTTSGGFGNAFSLTPDVWYGANRGTAHLDSSGILTITSPIGAAPGPVNLKFLFPDGTEVFDPQFFSYGPFLQYDILSGASPAGGASGQLVGYGMPLDASGGTLSVGGVPAVITTTQTQYLPFAGTPFPSTFLAFTIPPGAPGWADLQIQTPNGNSTLPKSLFYAASVTDYASADTFTAVLFDPGRNQLYLSAGDHLDVFSLASNQFVTPITPPAQGTSKQFAGLALTPDGSLLLAGDLLDGSLAVVNPDSPAQGYAIPISAPSTVQSCTDGPLYVAALAGNQALVAFGGLPAIGCGPGGAIYQADLAARTTVPSPVPQDCGGYISATSDGTLAAVGGSSLCIYNTRQNTISRLSTSALNGAAISGDGNVAAAQWVFSDSMANEIGRVGLPGVYYGAYSQDISSNFYLLQEPKLNDSGSLYYLAYPDFFDIVDVQHEILRMRFSLTEGISNTAVPMAIDSAGRRVFLLANKGLTVVDLGAAPLSIGSLSATNVSPGTMITVRGSGFSQSTTVTIGGQPATAAFVDEETLMVTVPAVGPGPVDILLMNPDGQTYLDQSVLVIQ